MVWVRGEEAGKVCQELALTRPCVTGQDGHIEQELIIGLDSQWLREWAPAGLHTVTINGRRYIPADGNER